MPKVSARSRSDSSSETNGTGFPCKSCDKTFDRSSDYRRHERTHTGERPHRCTWPGCSKSFAQSSGLKTHMNTHTGAQPHLCGYCDSKFGDPSSRSRHRREVHGDEGTHECPYAGCHSTIKRPKMFYDHVYEKHNVRLTPEEVEACNPYIRNGICPRSKRSQSGRKSARTLVLASTSPSTALEPTYLYADGVESSPILQLPVPLAVPVIPESYPNQSTRNMFYTYDMGSPFVESSASASPSPSSIYGCDDSQSQQGYNSPHTSGTPMGMHDQAFNLNYLTIPHSYAASSSSHSYSTFGSPALTCRSSVASPSLSPSPAPETMETTRLYSTVHHATPEPELLMGFSLDMGQVALGDPLGTLNLKDIERDVQMETFLASLNEGVDNHGMGPENSASSPWGIEQGYGINGMSVVGQMS
ncbi:MAG: hypothetical protein NXY57DRAFT_489872 [Lentinula lateritia]|uniref:C2H2-type domain-containing protein n=1 Tax=Lentinula lateritia TaxID=40482 RepID=A0ABQ8V278_9AGAR|nr:MAG: hypothetical protein NXY57DRAFT_489872 [Lentinula lateritia]KAJ4470313.1 hypothetical protein C8R41DRAFT_619703 [Lentinula lateritia]